ncbi:endogenous retrovirus group K member 24 Gag polyproteinpolyprotein-like isoform X1 [Podarcis lilfordi]|uniref:Endogenous retrovirus group K member 24 Gag polyproteinpolyprotein-like isoform X1 n=1 Tax=Podarcis lilfordi TaxID=74358 RepID=A0AA35PCZ8_9SAUR|nr:endogenous retrovirus group K member 24 Gag polyproteinpolyprotein-like isoform X1 [Podarcis lilfordi]
MLGRGPFAQASVQATLLQILLRDTALAAKQAMRKIPEPTSIQSRWGSIRQEARESYSSFMDRLLTAVSRQIENPEAKQIIIKQLAFENANEDCKLALRPIIHNPATDTAAMLRICQSVGTATHKAYLLAAALNENQPVATDTTYFQGGKPGSPIPQWGIKQWPLPKEKSAAAAPAISEQLISEQLTFGHIEASSSHWLQQTGNSLLLHRQYITIRSPPSDISGLSCLKACGTPLHFVNILWVMH